MHPRVTAETEEFTGDRAEVVVVVVVFANRRQTREWLRKVASE
ncbi:hypothetical protein ABZT51_39375 [Streptomyces sp. NPDC005373]